MNKTLKEDSKFSELEKRAVVLLEPDKYLSKSEPLRFALLYGHFRSYNEREMNEQENLNDIK